MAVKHALCAQVTPEMHHAGHLHGQVPVMQDQPFVVELSSHIMRLFLQGTDDLGPADI